MVNILKYTFKDIILLYKNLLHWSISKILIFLYSTFIWFLSIVPFAIVFYIYSLFSWIAFLDFINSVINSVFMIDLFWNILYLISLFSYIISYFFSFILFIKLYNGYLEWNKTLYLNKSYLDYKLYLKYLLLTLLGLLIFILPIFVFLIIIFVLILIFGWVDATTSIVIWNYSNLFSIISLVFFLLLLVWLYYLFYRFIFSYMILVDKRFENLSIKEIFKKSYNITKWYKKFIKTTFIFILFLSLYLPFFVTSIYISWNYNDLNSYSEYLNLKPEDQVNMKWINTYLYEWLEQKFDWKKINFVNSMQSRYYIYLKLFNILEFLFIFWVFTMILNSVYNRVIMIDYTSDKKLIEKLIEKIKL